MKRLLLSLLALTSWLISIPAAAAPSTTTYLKPQVHSPGALVLPLATPQATFLPTPFPTQRMTIRQTSGGSSPDEIYFYIGKNNAANSITIAPGLLNTKYSGGKYKAMFHTPVPATATPTITRTPTPTFTPGPATATFTPTVVFHGTSAEFLWNNGVASLDVDSTTFLYSYATGSNHLVSNSSLLGWIGGANDFTVNASLDFGNGTTSFNVGDTQLLYSNGVDTFSATHEHLFYYNGASRLRVIDAGSNITTPGNLELEVGSLTVATTPTFSGSVTAGSVTFLINKGLIVGVED